MHKTDQERFWTGEFGDTYIDRTKGMGVPEVVARNAALFAKALDKAAPLDSILEMGANIGLNLMALNLLFPNTELHAVEINAKAVEQLEALPFLTQAHHGSLLDIELDRTYDLTFTKTVLIHINPDKLQDVYAKLYQYSKRYILIAEYYNPTPTQVTYRGHTDVLFKRDFPGEMLEKYPDLRLVDYGFVYKRDAKFPQDDINWFLLEK